MGIIKLFAGNYAPQNYLMCDGSLLPISQFSALFSLLGTSYGGNGTTTFALPDLRGQVPVGAGQSKTGTSYILGQVSGTENVTITVPNLPAHTHNGSVVVNNTNSTLNAPVAGAALGVPGALSGRDFVASLGYVNAAPNVALSNASVVTTPTGSNIPVNNMQPYLALNYIICVYGVYPPRQ